MFASAAKLRQNVQLQLGDVRVCSARVSRPSLRGCWFSLNCRKHHKILHQVCTRDRSGCSDATKCTNVHAPTFGPSQHEAEALVLLLLEHHGLLVHHAVTVEEMPSGAAVSAAHHPQHGHGRPGRVQVHAAGGELVRPGAGQGSPDPTPPPPTPPPPPPPPLQISNGLTAAPTARRQHLQNRDDPEEGGGIKGGKKKQTATTRSPLPSAPRSPS